MAYSSQRVNSSLFPQIPGERLNKIGGIVPEILDVFTFFRTTHFSPEKRLSCEATPCRITRSFLQPEYLYHNL